MSMSFYDDMAMTAAELITAYGQPVVITRSQLVLDPVTNEETTASGTALQGTFTAISVPVTNNADDSLVDYTLIADKLRDLVVVAKDAPFVPAALDVLTMGGADLKVLSSVQISPAGTPVVYKLRAQL